MDKRSAVEGVNKHDYKAGAQKVHSVREVWQPQQGDADSRRRWLDKLKG